VPQTIWLEAPNIKKKNTKAKSQQIKYWMMKLKEKSMTQKDPKEKKSN